MPKPQQQVPYSSAGFDQNAATGAVPVQPGTQLETDQVTLVYALVPRGDQR